MMRHPDYNPPALYADIALMELNTSVTFSNVIRAACLYQQHDVYSHFPTISGWGTTEIGKNFQFQYLQNITLQFKITEFSKRKFENLRRVSRYKYLIFLSEGNFNL